MGRRNLQNKLVAIRFRDHSLGHKNHSLTVCTVYGKITDESKDHFEVTSWEVEDDDGSNHESFNILKSTIKSITILKEPKAKL
jgi:hypothetical protein